MHCISIINSLDYCLVHIELRWDSKKTKWAFQQDYFLWQINQTFVNRKNYMREIDIDLKPLSWVSFFPESNFLRELNEFLYSFSEIFDNCFVKRIHLCLLLPIKHSSLPMRIKNATKYKVSYGSCSIFMLSASAGQLVSCTQSW